ncbi:uncharacterized protein LOC110455359 isoform X2 [Mizuhopecten yessoensis]|uniref:Uncharacterized protein n=1 Tax=Mizuhopecten yessoensis TaxID=6573 RepID=A0A210R497_MIZYE|nr:uncharacterized protein LOC110455359 isoform X2 [Mizuhopecten yessoensis]OWF55798.1 hypothetical protein KP79_PYT10839 [Mizuhopecten yessoensis]
MCECVSTRLWNNVSNLKSWFVLTILCSVYFEVRSECPMGAVESMRRCIRTSLPNFGLGPPAGEPPNALREGIDMMRESCENSKLVVAAECMQNILDRCRGMTEEEQLLQRLFDKDEIVNTVRFFCDNLHIYERHTKCIMDQHAAASECSSAAKMSYTIKISANAPIDVLILSTCTFLDEAASCLTGTVDLNCGNEAASFLETILLGTRPPACGDKMPVYSVDGNSGSDDANILSGKTNCLIISIILTIVFQLRRMFL